MRIVLAFVLPLATASFILGAMLPLLEMQRLWLLVDTPSLVAVVTGLWHAGEWLLAVVIGLFSLVFPTVKLAYLHVMAVAGRGGRLHGALSMLGNWSMLDVLLVALVIFAARTSGLATAISQPGLWFFAASVALTALASQLLKRIRRREEASGGVRS
ncbi:MAG: paraquat-inducible protein A [Planctomycetales bacterium]|nr:paraquat-inducible protein A [Planctomycetales bacterium]